MEVTTTEVLFKSHHGGEEKDRNLEEQKSAISSIIKSNK